MKIQSPLYAPPRNLTLGKPSPVSTPESRPEQDSFERNKQPQPTPPPEKDPNWGPQILGGFAGALVGILAGHAGPAGVALVAGAGAAAMTLNAAGPMFKESLENGATGNPLHDIILACGTIAAGSMLLATTGAAAAGLAYPVTAGLASAIPLAAPLIGGAIGASVGGHLGIHN